MTTRYDHFYDAQIKRFLVQFVRAFSGFQYEHNGKNGKVMKIVPCTMAKRNRQVAAIMRNLSENTLLSVPMFTVAMTGLEYFPELLQNPSFVDTIHVLERAKDPVTGELTNERGNATTIERLMPRPFKLKVQLDLWTSNEDQKHQLMEQLLYIIFPSFDIQNSDTAVDWGALSTVIPDAITWSSRSIEIGTESEIEVTTVEMTLPFWLSPPAKIKRQTIIKKIITNINDAAQDTDGSILQGPTMSRQITTAGDYMIEVNNGELKLLGPHGSEKDAQGSVYSWVDAFTDMSVDFHPCVTRFRLRTGDLEDDARDIIGTLQESGAPNILDWQIDVDTLPANTLPPVHAVIDPMRSFPGEHGIDAIQGRRYLLTRDLAVPSQAWGAVTASKGAILVFDGGEWKVSFNGAPSDTDQYVTNMLTGRQLRWYRTEWVHAINGTYRPGFWFID